MNLDNSTQTVQPPAELRSANPDAPRAGVGYAKLDLLRAIAVSSVFLGHVALFHGLLNVGPIYSVLGIGPDLRRHRAKSPWLPEI